MGPLEDLNDSKLIVYESKWFPLIIQDQCYYHSESSEVSYSTNQLLVRNFSVVCYSKPALRAPVYSPLASFITLCLLVIVQSDAQEVTIYRSDLTDRAHARDYSFWHSSGPNRVGWLTCDRTSDNLWRHRLADVRATAHLMVSIFSTIAMRCTHFEHAMYWNQLDRVPTWSCRNIEIIVENWLPLNRWK